MYRILITLVLLFIGSPANAENAAAITIASDTQSIFLGDSVVLDIESRGLLDPLDVDHLIASADFLRETTGTRIAVVEGKVVEVAIRRMEFIPTQKGTISFGPLTGESNTGIVTSNTLTVAVQAALSTQWQPETIDLQSEVSFSNPQPIVGEQIIVDIKLRHTHQIASEQIKLPEFIDFDVLPIFEQRRTIEGDGEWRQIAWRFLAHPNRSGLLTLNPIQWSGTMIKSRSQRGEFDREWKTPKLQVRSAPADRPDWWLPATSVKLSDQWSKQVIELDAGDEIIRTITLMANNVLSSQLPDIAPYPTRALTSTLIRTTREHKLVNDHTVATAVFDYRMVAQSPIPVFLDTVRVPWWDVVKNSHEEAILPARRINVGLPDRADLLADLAINKSRWSLFVFKLRSYARWQPIIIGLCLLACFLVLLPLLRDGVKFHFLTRRRYKTLRSLEKLRAKKNWPDLYKQLIKLNTTKHAVNINSEEYQTLIKALQLKLFSKNDLEVDILSKNINLPLATQHLTKPRATIETL